MTITAPTTAMSASTAASTAGSSSTGSALGSLSGNLTNFLSLLMTQLQNQDPTSPMDTNAFTSQLVQYASVEQQINANTNLTNLISATQSNTMLQASSLVGKQVTATNDHLALQDGTAKIHFTATTAEPVTVTVVDGTGATLAQANVSAQSGNNDWTWDGKDTSGRQVVDGSYKVMVNERSGAALTTTVTGTVTGMSRTGNAVNAVLGGLQTSVDTIQTVGS